MGPGHDLHQHAAILRTEWKNVAKDTGKNHELIHLLNKSIQTNHWSYIGAVCNHSQKLCQMIIKRKHDVVLYNILRQIIIILPWHRSHTGKVRVNQMYFSDSLEQEFRKHAVVSRMNCHCPPTEVIWVRSFVFQNTFVKAAYGFENWSCKCTRLSRCV
jgi:hypothetical protein